MSTNVKRYAGDFETTTDPNDVRVWASCMVDIETGKTAFIGNDIESFFEYLKPRNSIVYFHNLKFDGEFILSYLLSHGYTHSDTREPKTFDTLITDSGVFYSLTVYFAKKNKKHRKVTFYDSLKKLPFKVSVIAEAFELVDRKLSIDYTAPRPKGHVLTPEEVEYIVADCRIVAQALNIQFGKGLKKMTNASDAMGDYKERIGKNYFEKWFPSFPIELDADIRRAYKGGFTYVNPRFQNQRIKGGLTFDVNSLYPWAMYYCMLPYGYPMYFEGEYEPDPSFPLYIARIRCEFKLKEGHIPTIQLKNNRAFIETEYLESSNGEIVEMTLTSVDMSLLLDHYDTPYLEWVCGWKFRAITGLFKPYIDYWMHIKETTTGAMRQLAKLMLNSLYGKFATNPKSRKKLPMLDHDGVVRYTYSDIEYREPVYTAVGAFITAYAREKTIRTSQKVYDRYLYSDTDSIHIKGYDIPEGLEIHATRLGAWKLEGVFVDSLFVRPKTYIETLCKKTKDSLREYCRILNDRSDVWRMPDGYIYHTTETKEKVTCAGMPDNLKTLVTYNNFHSGSTFEGKLMPKRFKGGVVLMPYTFTIK